ncbi:hypothetical protein ACVWWD_006062 [Mesorhizobium sp. URHB0026]
MTDGCHIRRTRQTRSSLCRGNQTFSQALNRAINTSLLERCIVIAVSVVSLILVIACVLVHYEAFKMVASSARSAEVGGFQAEDDF